MHFKEALFFIFIVLLLPRRIFFHGATQPPRGGLCGSEIGIIRLDVPGVRAECAAFRVMNASCRRGSAVNTVHKRELLLSGKCSHKGRQGVE
jgi:hypothetical protein